MDAPGQEFLRGTLKTIVLNLLAEPTPDGPRRMYGYEITQAVHDRTRGDITLSFGALYPVLHKLEQDGLLLTDTEAVDGRLRKYYSLTPQGNQAAIQKTTDFERFVRSIRSILQPPGELSPGL